MRPSGIISWNIWDAGLESRSSYIIRRGMSSDSVSESQELPASERLIDFLVDESIVMLLSESVEAGPVKSEEAYSDAIVDAMLGKVAEESLAEVVKEDVGELIKTSSVQVHGSYVCRRTSAISSAACPRPRRCSNRTSK